MEFLATGITNAHKNLKSQTRTENQSSINELVSSLNTSIHILIDAMNKTEIEEPTDSTQLFRETISETIKVNLVKEWAYFEKIVNRASIETFIYDS